MNQAKFEPYRCILEVVAVLESIPCDADRDDMALIESEHP
jgi:hypothetical protein